MCYGEGIKATVNKETDMQITFAQLSLKGKISLIKDYLTYYPETLFLWSIIDNNFKHTSIITGRINTKASILKEILKMNYRRHWLRSIIEDQDNS